LRPRFVDVGWVVFAAVNLGAMVAWPSWETIPFHFIWVSLTIVYGFRVWRGLPTVTALTFVWATTGTLILIDVEGGKQLGGELTEVPLMSAMFLAMVWHARRRQDALRVAERLAEDRAALLSQQERFLHDASHELRTPVTIAAGSPRAASGASGRAPRRSRSRSTSSGGSSGSSSASCCSRMWAETVWSGCARSSWKRFSRTSSSGGRTSPRAYGGWGPWRRARSSPTRRASALRWTRCSRTRSSTRSPPTRSSVAARSVGGGVEISVVDEGVGIPAEAIGRIFERFARADAARTRNGGGAGLGLAIVDAIAKAHGGECSVESSERGARFVLRLPRFSPVAALRTDPRLLAVGEPVGAALLEERV